MTKLIRKIFGVCHKCGGIFGTHDKLEDDFYDMHELQKHLFYISAAKIMSQYHTEKLFARGLEIEDN